ncbi:MAG: peptidyl-prolyl cis-trans isomerase [Campylobacterota bacterium]|nr:peptidyl-prolyl cis-trans isomerase [Campylobacterota bacterium]
MKKLILLGLITLLTFTHAKMVDGIALIVEGEAITTAEIRAIKKQLRVSKSDAIDLLIQDRLQKAAMKDIAVSEDEVDEKVKKIATQNKISIKKMQKVLKKRGTSWTKYRASIKESIKKERFYRTKVISTISEPTEDQLKIFYKNHKKEFTIPSSIKVIEYSSKSEKSLTKFLQTKKRKNVKRRTIKKYTKKLDPTMLSTLLRTPKGSFTRSFNAGDKYISYKVLSTHGKVNMPFKSSKDVVASRWRQQQQSKALKDYFQKMKTNADIQVIRK